jgi:hypothetical protein
VGKCINIDTPVAGCCPSLSGGTGYCHGVGNIPVEASGSTRVGTSFFPYIRPCLSFSPSPFGISLPQTWPCIIPMYSTITFDTIEEDLENERKTKDQASPKNLNSHVPVRGAVCTGSRPRKVQLKCFIRPATAQFLPCPLLNKVHCITRRSAAIRASGRWYRETLPGLLGRSSPRWSLSVVVRYPCNGLLSATKPKLQRQCTLTRPKIGQSFSGHR